ncbi:MAG: GatB/YqeY domain-containing protein [Deltaproteobacteria bacterium]|nr:MAG: GatB/YqeY domain-containing protein [Deltaproteobacteria bacterium]RLB09349.1 MAG: GatB/YqeY domain-containing protein [Deltaproteobacteria bacterium]
MSLLDQIHSDLKEAMKAKDSIRLGALRLILTAVKNKEKELRRELEEREVLQIVSNQIKQRKDSIEQYRKGGREDLVQKEEQELEILQAYMPQQLSEEELEKLVTETIKEVGATSVKDLGKVMKAIMPRIAGRADGKVVNQMVRAQLSSTS